MCVAIHRILNLNEPLAIAQCNVVNLNEPLAIAQCNIVNNLGLRSIHSKSQPHRIVQHTSQL